MNASEIRHNTVKHVKELPEKERKRMIESMANSLLILFGEFLKSEIVKKAFIEHVEKEID